MALAGIAPTGKVGFAATSTSQNAAIPATGTPTTCLVTNMGESACYVQLGTSNAVVATAAASAIVLPERTLVLTIGANTFIAVIGNGPVDCLFGT